MHINVNIMLTKQYPVKQQPLTKQCPMPRRNYQQMMWHARSMESGLGK